MAARPEDFPVIEEPTPAEYYRNRRWHLLRGLLFRWSPSFAHGWRRGVLRLAGARIAPDVRLDRTTLVDFPWNLDLRAGVRVDRHAIFFALGGITVGENTRISQHAHLCAASRDLAKVRMPITNAPIEIGRDAWIGADVFVGPGARVGDRCIVGARSAVFGELPAGSVCTGEPAKPQHPR